MSALLRAARFRPRRTAVALAIVAGATVLLSGCSGGDPAESTEPPATTAPPATATAEPTAAPTDPAEQPTPLAIDCQSLITPEQMYEFNPNYGVAPGYSPDAADVALTVENGGTACGWSNQTSGEIIEVGVATPTETVFTDRKAQAAVGSTAVPTYGTPPAIEGFFRQAGETGEAQVFTEAGVWLVISSPALFEPGDAQQLVAAALGNLP